MKTVAIIQARMGSTRLPGKVLMDVAGQPMIERVFRRVEQARAIDEVVVATSRQKSDERLRDHCRRRSWKCFVGDEQDVLSRYYGAAQWAEASHVVRITADCPLIDAGVIDRVVRLLKARPDLDLVSNIWPRRRYPRGLDVEALTWETLAELHEKCNLPAYREHVTLAAYREKRHHLGSVECREDWSHWRLTVDTEDDLRLVREIYRHFLQLDVGQTDLFGFSEMQKAMRRFPQWETINRHIQQKAA